MSVSIILSHTLCFHNTSWCALTWTPFDLAKTFLRHFSASIFYKDMVKSFLPLSTEIAGVFNVHFEMIKFITVCTLLWHNFLIETWPLHAYLEFRFFPFLQAEPTLLFHAPFLFSSVLIEKHSENG